jgi:hypothetical protein
MWERRFGLDEQLGIPPPEHLLHRLKFRVIGRLPQELRAAPSVSMVLGRYGDIVIRSNGTAYSLGIRRGCAAGATTSSHRRTGTGPVAGMSAVRWHSRSRRRSRQVSRTGARRWRSSSRFRSMRGRSSQWAKAT